MTRAGSLCSGGSKAANALTAIERLSAENERLRVEHEAYRPEVAAEIAVQLTDDADWPEIARWCGGRLDGETLPSGDYSSWINVGGERAGEGAWITLGHDGVFRVRWSLDGPERADLVAENERLREALRDAAWLARLARGSSWPGEMAQRVEDAADRVTAAASLSETGGEAEQASEREWYCVAQSGGLPFNWCSPDEPIHNAPCGWTGGEGA